MIYLNSSSILSLVNMALYSNKAILIGRAKVSEQIHKDSSMILPPALLFGQRRIFSRRKLPTAGKNKTGRGRTTLDTAVSMIAFLPANFDFP